MLSRVGTSRGPRPGPMPLRGLDCYEISTVTMLPVLLAMFADYSTISSTSSPPSPAARSLPPRSTDQRTRLTPVPGEPAR